MTYAAFLRGINVGGKTLIKMASLKKTLEKAGFKRVRTILASGNVLFDSASHDSRSLQKRFEKAVGGKIGREIHVNVRPIADLQRLAKSDPFGKIDVTKDTRLYVTFLDANPKKHLESSSDFFRVIKTCPFAVCTSLVLTPDRGTLDLMGTLEKHYGQNITTRNWNTVRKVIAAA